VCFRRSYYQLVTLFVGLLLQFSASAQQKEPQVINAGGGYFSRGDLLFDWSFGELISVQTLSSNTDFIVTTGFLQSKLDALTPFNPIGPADSNKIFAGPNPTRSLITIRSTLIEPGRIQVLLTTATGMVLQKMEEAYEGLHYQKQLNLSRYPSGFYNLIVTYLINGQPIKTSTYKIIKQ
jgi:hypothetical protein